jgi:hypothetical protein
LPWPQNERGIATQQVFQPQAGIACQDVNCGQKQLQYDIDPAEMTWLDLLAPQLHYPADPQFLENIQADHQREKEKAEPQDRKVSNPSPYLCQAKPLENHYTGTSAVSHETTGD